MSTARELSKQDWTGDSTIDSINSGSLQRIADAAEKMAQNHIALMRERDIAVRRLELAHIGQEALRRQLSAAKGQITKLKGAAKTKAASSTSVAA